MRGCTISVLLLAALCRSDEEVEGRARALLEAARRAKEPVLLKEPVSLSVENLGTLRVDPGVDPADVVEAFYTTAKKQNVTLTLTNLTAILSKLCMLAPCRRRFHHERLTANVKGVGTLVVEPWVEPARTVAELGRAAEAAGAPLGSVVRSFHTVALGTVEVTFVVTANTHAMCDAEGEVVSFTNLQISQNRNADVPEGKTMPTCVDGNAMFTQY